MTREPAVRFTATTATVPLGRECEQPASLWRACGQFVALVWSVLYAKIYALLCRQRLQRVHTVNSHGIHTVRKCIAYA